MPNKSIRSIEEEVEDSLHKVNAHKVSESLLTVRLSKADINLVITEKFGIFLGFTCEYIVARRIN